VVPTGGGAGALGGSRVTPCGRGRGRCGGSVGLKQLLDHVLEEGVDQLINTRMHARTHATRLVLSTTESGGEREREQDDEDDGRTSAEAIWRKAMMALAAPWRRPGDTCDPKTLKRAGRKLRANLDTVSMLDSAS